MGLTKKGKEFFKLTSSLTESIRNIVVEDTKIWTGCEFVYNLYDNGQDTAFYMSRDQINALAIGNQSTNQSLGFRLFIVTHPLTHTLSPIFLMFPFIEHVTRENEYDVVLACQDNLIRIVAGSALVCEVPTDAPVTAVASRDDNYMKSRKGVASILFGMEDGSISATNIASDGTSRTLWITMDAPKRSPVGEISNPPLLPPD